MPIIVLKKKKLFIFITLLAIIIAVISIKPIGKLVYPIKYKEYILKYSEEYSLDPLLVTAIIRVESNFYTHAKSHKDARGLMQISEVTGRWAAKEIRFKRYNEDLLYNPEINIHIGCWYLWKLKEQFNDNLSIVLAAYNGGSGNVTKWLKDIRYSSDGINLKKIPFKETEEYVDKVIKTYRIYKLLYKEMNTE